MVAACVLGSGAVFLEGSVVSVAVPAIARDFSLGVDGVQWVLNGYMLTLSSLMLLGGSLGDSYGRRKVFAIGLIAFAVASLLCSIAPSLVTLVAARAIQGAAGAVLVPNSLAILESDFAADDRGAAIGQWAGWSAASTALGPFVGGWLVDVLSWRWVFVSISPFAVGAAVIAVQHVPAEHRKPEGRIDFLGAAVVTLALAGLMTALISGARLGASNPEILAAAIGGTLLVIVFVFVERRASNPLLPLSMFRSMQFSGANLETLFVYAALNGLFFFLMLQLQNNVGYSALAAGAAILPVNFIMLGLSPLAGRLATRIGPRIPMTVGAFVAGAGMILLARINRGAEYTTVMLPAFVVFGLGLAIVVAPLTAAVLAAVPERRSGVASAINNAVARLAGLLAVAVLPLVAGVAGLSHPSGPAFAAGYRRAMWICAVLCALGGVIAFATIRRQRDA
ncbi:MAG TPA: DHA2 family efflux MFS transporter permease subunit [Gemmatimonadaceae bacterium]